MTGPPTPKKRSVLVEWLQVITAIAMLTRTALELLPMFPR